MNGRKSTVFYDFGPFRLHPAERLLLRGGTPIPMTPKVFDLLVTFVENRGRALPKQELLETVWPGTFVEEGSLTRTVSTLRQILGDAGPDFIETISKFGYRFTPPVREVGAPESKAIAVLPFQHLGGDDAGDLAVGLADALIAKLAPLRRLVVRPTSAVLRYADNGAGAAAAARELQVDLVLEGTIRTAGGRMRVSAQLVCGETGAAIWSGRFEAALTDLFSIEEQAAEQIVAALSIHLTAGEQRRLAKRGTANAEAYRLYLKGRHFWNRRTGESVQKAIRYFEEAIAHDPEYAAAHCGLADCHLIAGDVDPAAAAAHARAAARRALELDDSLGEAHTTLARIEWAFDWNWAAAEERFRRAVELSPEYPTARQWRANFLAAAGRPDEAIAEIECARALDPLSVAMHTASGWIHYMARRYDESIARYREALEIDPTFLHARRQIAMAYEQVGRFGEAMAMLRELPDDPLAMAMLAHASAVAGESQQAREAIAKCLPLAERHTSLLQILGATHVALGDRDAALALLGRARNARASTLMWLKVDPWFDPLRGDEEFRKVLRTIDSR